MSIDELERRIEQIRALYAIDPEAAHSEEDRLVRVVLGEIVADDLFATAYASTLLALLTDQSLRRWYA